MHQDYLRLAVHSSLTKVLPVGCDNGNEACKCGTNRRSKAPSPDAMKRIVDNTRGCGGLDRTPARGQEEVEAVPYRENSELHLSHVLGGAKKLNQMIESLSNASILDRPSEYIAEDLLGGALDLQESLIMLSKLQEASKAMSERRRKPKLESSKGREEDGDRFSPEAMGSRRFAICGRHDKLQESRLSTEGSSRNCSKELKNLIRDSLHRQNLLPISSRDEISSSSRSTSCRVEDPSNGPKEAADSISAIEPPKTAKSPNLIAKLMGLEEAPSGRTIKKVENKRINLARPGFDTMMPRAMKLTLAEQNTDQKEKSRQEKIETMQFIEFRGNDQFFEEISSSSDTQRSEELGRNAHKHDELPPIVLMKPLQFWERGEVQNNLLLGKASVPEEINSVKLIQESKGPAHVLMLPKTLGRKNVKKMEKTVVESSQKKNTSAAEFQKKHKKDSVERCRKTNVAQKPPLNGKKQEEKRDVKAVRAPISQAKSATARQAKPDIELSAANSDVRNQKSTPPVHNPRRLGRPVSPNYVGSARVKKTSVAKPVRKSTPRKTVNNTKKLEDGKVSDSKTGTLPNGDLPKPADQEQKPCYGDDTIKDQKIFCEVMPNIKIHKRLNPTSIPPADKVVNHITKVLDGKKSESAEMDKTTDIRKSAGAEEDMKRLLLSSQSFLSHAEEIFDLDGHGPIYNRRKGLAEIVTRDAKLFVDCGKEMLARKTYQRELLKHPLMEGHVHGQTLYTSLDQLVEEISNGIEKLIVYVAVDYDATPEDNLYVRLERDLRCKEMSMNIMWDLGWRNETCVEESDQIVSEVEEHIFSFLFEEIVTDLVY